MIHYQFSPFFIHLTLRLETGGTFEFTPNRARSITLIHAVLQNLISIRMQLLHKNILLWFSLWLF